MKTTLDLDAYKERLLVGQEYMRNRYKKSPEYFNMLVLAAIPHYQKIGFSDSVISQLTVGISASDGDDMK